MKKTFLRLLQCPQCHSALRLEVFEEANHEIQSGTLTCDLQHVFPIIQSIPRMVEPCLLQSLVVSHHPDYFRQFASRLPDDLSRLVQLSSCASSASDDQTADLKYRTAESFAYEWKAFHRMFDAYKQNFLNYIAPLDEHYFPDKVVLDAGCGVGRHSYWAEQFGAEVVAMDLGEAVEAAQANCRSERIHVVQADILHPPFGSVFDGVFSIGVLHHLPTPEAGFHALIPTLKNGGTMCIWVYGKQHNEAALYLYEPVRKITRAIPHGILKKLCIIPAIGVEGMNQLTRLFNKFKSTKSLAHRLPFHYYAQFPFEVKVNDAFDVFATPKSSYWTMEEIQGWFQRANLESVHLGLLRKKSITAIGTKPQAHVNNKT